MFWATMPNGQKWDLEQFKSISFESSPFSGKYELRGYVSKTSYCILHQFCDVGDLDGFKKAQDFIQKLKKASLERK